MPVLAHDSQGIGAKPEIRSMSKGDVARIARKDIPARSGCSEHQGKYRDGGYRRIGKQQWKRKHNKQQSKQSDCFENLHCFLPSTCPSNPCGRTNRIITSRMKKTVLAQTGDQITEVTSSIMSIPNEAMSAPLKLPMPPKMMMASRREIRS